MSTTELVKEIKDATEQDLEQILELQKKAFYSQALIYNDFNLPPLTQTIDDLKNEFRHKAIYKVELEGRIIASVRCHIKDDTLHVERLIVDPDLQGRGIGTKIMNEIERRYSHIVNRFELFTGHKSERSLHLYSKLGYKEVGQESLSDDCRLIHLEKVSEKEARYLIT